LLSSDSSDEIEKENSDINDLSYFNESELMIYNDEYDNDEYEIENIKR
jgi:hypothetical protein